MKVQLKLHAQGTPKAEFASGALSPKVKLGSKPAKAQMGESSVTPKVKLAATKPARASFGEAAISPYVRTKNAR